MTLPSGRLDAPIAAELLQWSRKMSKYTDDSREMMHAALDINLPNYSSAIVATKEIVESILSLRPA
jgi:hypothetical protein